MYVCLCNAVTDKEIAQRFCGANNLSSVQNTTARVVDVQTYHEILSISASQEAINAMLNAKISSSITDAQ